MRVPFYWRGLREKQEEWIGTPGRGNDPDPFIMALHR
jgi:hypothetical protein